MAVSTGTGRYPMKTGAEKKDQSHGDPGSDGNRLRFSTVLFIEGGAGDTAVYWAAAYCGGNNISGGTGQDFLTVVQLIIIAERKGILCKKSFCHNDNSNHKTAACRLGSDQHFRNPGSPGREAHVLQTAGGLRLFRPHEKPTVERTPRAIITIAMGNFGASFLNVRISTRAPSPMKRAKQLIFLAVSEDMLCQFQELSDPAGLPISFGICIRMMVTAIPLIKTAHNRCGDKVHDLICVKQKMKINSHRPAKMCDGRNIIHGSF